MPRLPLDEHEAAAIAAYFAERSGFDEDSPAALPAGDIERGRGYFATKGCVGCHAFTGARTQAPPEVLPRDVADRALAPDLRYARDRVVHGRLAAWIRDPTAFKPDSAMPKQQLTPQEAEDLATFVLQAPLDDVPAPAAFARLPVLERPVGYDEVAKKVLHKICWHCHSQPDFARGDGGPGNTGGFGFAPRKLDLSSYESIAGGYLDASGKRRSVFSAAPSGEPMLLAVLLERTREERGAWSPLRGMPLGLPPLSAEDIQLVESWIAQGHPR
jgi:mono/diheme cytochrome c family protein